MGLTGVRAAGDPYTISNIAVDASAPSAVEAQTLAINSGRDKAWQALYRKLTKQQDWGHQPVLDPVTLQRMVRSYAVSKERRSTTRFVASMTYVFNPEAVRRVLRQANVAFADVAAKPLLVIPMSPGYAPHTPWAQAFADPHIAKGSVPLLLPLGDAVDSSALGALQFGNASWQDIEPAASRMHATEAWLALAEPGTGHITIKLKRLGAGASPSIPDVNVTVPPKTPPAQAFASAANAAAAAIVDAWKAHSVVDFGKKAKLFAALHVDSLEDWSEMLKRLGSASNVTNVDVVALDIGEARVAISYVGSPDQLNDQLAHAGLSLASADGQMWLSRASSSAATP
ncbi:MAG TPA: DUF2066 domain-containing protein [Rhizomicrobium sp.]|nr:DUF2066 domain-containing protein [Rhizomicrobium sp.]